MIDLISQFKHRPKRAFTVKMLKEKLDLTSAQLTKFSNATKRQVENYSKDNAELLELKDGGYVVKTKQTRIFKL